MLIDTQKITKVASLGTLSSNTANIRGLVKQIVVKPTQETTMYDVTIINPLGAIIYQRTSEQGTLAELIELPVSGIYTVSVNNATVDESFTIQIIIQE